MNSDCQRLLANYRIDAGLFESAAKEIGDAIAERLKDASIQIHVVEARAKSVDSLARKLRKKNYATPEAQTTDLVGVRVITLFRSDVDQAVRVLRTMLEVDEANSVDKRHQLSTYEFGYRSVHLVGRVGSVDGALLPDGVLDYKLEIQVRSVLEHAWAEMEHELVYKTRTTYSDDTLRTFGAVAGALELMDRFFEEFRSAFALEVEERHAALSRGEAWEDPDDAAGTVAALEVITGTKCGWRSELGSGFPPHSSALVCEALIASGLETPGAMRSAYAKKKCSEAIQRFAALHGITVTDVSHLAAGGLLAGVQPGFDFAEFPDLYGDSTLIEACSAVGAAPSFGKGGS